MASDRLAYYRRRIEDVAPDLHIDSLRLVEGHGQNNDVVVVNDDWIFRFPRHLDGVRRLAGVVRILRAVRPRVEIAIPDPTYVRLEPPETGEAFLGYRMLPGVPLTRDALGAIDDETALRRLAAQVAACMEQIHGMPLAEVPPSQVAAFDPLTGWADLFERIRLRLFPSMRLNARAAVERHFEAFLDDPASRAIAPTLIHGDFGTGNLLYDTATLTLTGVIDFDSSGLGDPAVDVAAALSGPRAFVEELRTRCDLLPAADGRVRFYRGTFLLQEALHGVEHDDPEAFRSGIAPYV